MGTPADRDALHKKPANSMDGRDTTNISHKPPVVSEIVSLGKVTANTFGHGKQWEDNGVHSARQ